MMLKPCLVVAFVAVASTPSYAQEVPAEYQQVLSTLGKQGDFKDNVLKVNIPRNDVKVTVAGVATPTPFGFGGWVAMTKGDGGHHVLMGDLVLLQEEVNPVMTALLENGFDVTALHNHFFWDEPRMFYMHVHGHGAAADLARKLKPALDLIGKSGAGAPQTPASGAPQSTLNTARLAEIVGAQGEQTGAVYKFTLGRTDLKVTEMGASINARMGLNTWNCRLADARRSVSRRRWMRRSTLKCHSCRPGLNASVSIGMRISTVHPRSVRRVSASQMPSQFGLSVSPPGSIRASYRAPPGFTAKTYPDRPSRNVSSTTRTWSSDRSTASRCLLKLTMPDGSGSSHSMPTTTAFGPASTRTRDAPLAGDPSAGSACVKPSATSACRQSSSSKTPLITIGPVNVPARTR